MTHSVYWLFDEFCNNPATDGYIGVTKNLRNRLTAHRRERFSTFEVSILFKGTEEQCYTYEQQLRPNPKLGWNFAPGGPEGYKRVNGGYKNKGKKHTNEFRRQKSEQLKGRSLPPEHRAAIKAAMKDFKPSPKANIAARAVLDLLPPPMLGKKHSEETKAKMRASFWARRQAGTIYRGGNKMLRHTEETKALLRAARLQQADPRLGTKHTPDTLEKMRLARLTNPQPRDPITGLLISRD